MTTGELKVRIDRIWDAFWSGGIANPLADQIWVAITGRATVL